MRDFFQGWKRKAGCVALVVACLCMAAWLRSAHSTEVINWDNDSHEFILASIDTMFVVGIGVSTESFQWAWPEFASTERSDFEDETEPVVWCLNLAGIRFGMLIMPPPNHALCLLAVSYPFIVIPLTLLSAWLLLSMPRKANRTHADEPIPVKVA